MEKVKLSKDGNSIDFTAAGELPSNPKKFRASVEVESFYRFVHENDLRKESLEIIERVIARRKAEKVAARASARKSRDN
jgi:hypothetical protein